MTTETKITSFCLKVRGYVWAGYRSSYEYAVQPDQLPKTLKDAKRIAGDFESLTSAKLIKTVRVISEERTVTKLK